MLSPGTPSWGSSPAFAGAFGPVTGRPLEKIKQIMALQLLLGGSNDTVGMKCLAANVWSQLYKTIILLLLWLWPLRSDGVIHRSSSVLDPFPILELYQPLIASCLPRAGRPGKWLGQGPGWRGGWRGREEGVGETFRGGYSQRAERGKTEPHENRSHVPWLPLWALIGKPSPGSPMPPTSTLSPGSPTHRSPSIPDPHPLQVPSLLSP